MSNKLTKNDSMSIEEHRFEVAVATFKALLHRRGLYPYYFQSWNCDNWRDINVPIEVAWEDWAKRGEQEDWISDAFIWKGSNIPVSVWCALNVEWIDYCDAYINK